MLGYSSAMQGTEPLLRWRFVPAARFSELAPHWQRLALKRSSAPFLQLEFIEPLLHHFAEGGEQIAVGERHGEITALAILAAPARGRRNSFQPSQLPLGPILIDEGLPVEAALEALTRQLPLSTLAVGFTQLDSALYPRPTATTTLAVDDYIQTAWVNVVGTFAEYWEARGKNLRQNIRKQRRKLIEDSVETRLEMLRDPALVAGAIADYGKLESSGWKASGGTAIHPSNAQGRFYREMLERFCANGRGCIYRYYFSGEVVAVDLCIEGEKSLVILKTTYDETIKTLSPAFLMREEAFARIWDEGRIQRIEFFGKLMDWHKRWTDNARDVYHLTNFRWGWVKRLRARTSEIAPLQESPGTV